MSKDETREERLAAKLRENLRRRKTQARAMAENGPETRKGDGPPAGAAQHGGANSTEDTNT